MHQFSSFLHQNLATKSKKVGKGYLDQNLECAAPKCWSKYTTRVRTLRWPRCKRISQTFFSNFNCLKVFVAILFPSLLSKAPRNYILFHDDWIYATNDYVAFVLFIFVVSLAIREVWQFFSLKWNFWR